MDKDDILREELEIDALEELKESYFKNLTSVEVTYPIKVRLSNGEIRQADTTYIEEEVPYGTWQEECHGYHTMYEYDEDFLSERKEAFYRNLTLDEVNLGYDKELGLTDELQAVEILEPDL